MVRLHIILAASLTICVSTGTSPYSAAAPTAEESSSASSIPTLRIDSAETGPIMHSEVLGINDGVLSAALPTAALYKSAGIRSIRYPGGSTSDLFDWKSGAICNSRKSVPNGAKFEHFMTDVVRPDHLDVEITVNFGTSNQPSCDAPGRPETAAEWVDFANNVHHYGIHWWELGNEVFGKWERDQSVPPHDAAVYSARSHEFAQLMKARDPSIQIGVPLSKYRSQDSSGNVWDDYVLSHAAYDYVALHIYPAKFGKEDDHDLLFNGPARIANSIEKVRSELAAAGKPDVPISVSEWNSVYATPGKQTVSIVNGLYAAEALGTMLDKGIRRAEFWNTFGCEAGGNGNVSDQLYGWQNFGSLGAFSEGVPYPTDDDGCHGDRTQTIAAGTLFPTARAFQLLSLSGFVTEGEHMLLVTVPPTLPAVRAYACTHGSGFGILLVNLDKSASPDVAIDAGKHGYDSRMRWTSYGKEQYDETANNGPWVDAVSGSRLLTKFPIVVSLPPWSMSVFMFSKD